MSCSCFNRLGYGDCRANGCLLGRGASKTFGVTEQEETGTIRYKIVSSLQIIQYAIQQRSEAWTQSA